MIMGRGSRLRRELFWRWLLWLGWTFGWIAVLWISSSSLLSIFLIVSVWIVGGWFGFFLFGPGKILSRVIMIKEARKERRFKELNDRFSMLDPDEDLYFDWVDECEEDDADIDRQLEREELDMLYGYIVNEGGKTGKDYRVVPWDVRRWSPPYMASDGLLTLHESSHGVSLDSVDPYDPLFGEPDTWAYDPLFAPDPIYLDGFTPYPEDEDDEYEDEEYEDDEYE